MATKVWVNIGSGNGLLLEDTKLLPEPMLILISECVIHLGTILQGVPQLLFCTFSLKMILSKLLPYFPLTLQGRHNGRDSVSNHQPYDCLLN